MSTKTKTTTITKPTVKTTQQTRGKMVNNKPEQQQQAVPNTTILPAVEERVLIVVGEKDIDAQIIKSGNWRDFTDTTFRGVSKGLMWLMFTPVKQMLEPDVFQVIGYASASLPGHKPVKGEKSQVEVFFDKDYVYAWTDYFYSGLEIDDMHAFIDGYEEYLLNKDAANNQRKLEQAIRVLAESKHLQMGDKSKGVEFYVKDFKNKMTVV